MAWVWPLHYRHVWRRNVCLGSNIVLRPYGKCAFVSWIEPDHDSIRIKTSFALIARDVLSFGDTKILPKCLRERLWTGLILSPSGHWRKRPRSLKVPHGTVTRRTWSSRRYRYSKVSSAAVFCSDSLLPKMPQYRYY